MTTLVEKIKDNADFVKVDRTYIVNINQEEYENTILRRQRMKRMESMEKEMDEMKTQLKTLMEKLNGN